MKKSVRKGGKHLRRRPVGEYRQPAAERRAQLLNCGIQAIARDGIEGITHAAVAKRARVAVGTVFAYFRTRQRLVSAILFELADHAVKHALETEPRKRQRDMPEAYLQHCREACKYADDFPEHTRAWLHWAFPRAQEDIEPRFREYIARFDQFTADRIQQWEARQGIERSAAERLETARILVASANLIAELKLAGISSRSIEGFMGSVTKGLFFADDLT